ncbi:uncharacterized protein Z520_00331 [Fonsecaea multimorphosa CBS 102226]|uniref:DUF1275 domain protein n=1 Tax=Fonsecaea multimorphosa CBS 102226 TaxID=1442371 RepID=A0A0D2KJH2_9EURO|nr:uncharacterized protein Z520_00331 [Fonsecaea multimorphosa CBS 102226]KIY03640.1 hypothetical protein Z520_00331 [Fonsecaea multimorphosa CBS 102226]OAL32340.1 hypothetical protein AYO22_00362 [Fonsecaea multimorphosa]
MGGMERLTRTADASQRYLFQELDSSYMSLVLVICFLISGLIDSVALNTWSCFVNIQTGNTVFAALGLGGQPKASHKQQYYKSLTSIGAFCLGALFFSALHRYPAGAAAGPQQQQPWSRRRTNLIISFFVQTALIAIAASLVSTNEVSSRPFVAGTFSSGNDEIPPSMINFLDFCPIALISFQAAGQVTLSRLLSVVELPTTVLSARYHDVCADLHTIRDSWRKSSSLWEFFVVRERRQERRAACILALFLGGVVGGEMYKSSAGMAGALWLAAGLKFGILIGWFCWKGQKGDHEDRGGDQIPR